MKALVLIAGLVTTAAWAQQAPPSRAPRVHVFEVPQAIEAIDVPERVLAGGLPVAIHAVRSKASVDTLIHHFRAAFAQAGLFLPPPQDLPLRTAQPQITGLDPDTFIAYTVFLQANADGTTTALITETFIAERQRPGEVDFAPVMPGAKGLVQSQTEGLRMISYRAPATEVEAWAFHRAVFEEAAWQETAPGVFEQDGRALRVVVQPTGKEEVSISVVERAAAAPVVAQNPLLEDDPAP